MTEAIAALKQALNQEDTSTNMFLYYKIDEILARSGLHDQQRRRWQVDLKLNRIAACVLLSVDPDFLEAVWTIFVVSPYFAQTDLASAPFELTDWLHKVLAYPRFKQLTGLATFQHEQGYYTAAFARNPYCRLLERIRSFRWACCWPSPWRRTLSWQNWRLLEPLPKAPPRHVRCDSSA